DFDLAFRWQAQHGEMFAHDLFPIRIHGVTRVDFGHATQRGEKVRPRLQPIPGAKRSWDPPRLRGGLARSRQRAPLQGGPDRRRITRAGSARSFRRAYFALRDRAHTRRRAPTPTRLRRASVLLGGYEAAPESAERRAPRGAQSPASAARPCRP